MKSRVQAINPIWENGQLKSWTSPQGSSFNFTVLTFENGDSGEYMHMPGLQSFFVLGQEAEYEKIPNQNPSFPSKIKPIREQKEGFQKGSFKGNDRSFALSYAKDVWVAKIAAGQDFKLADCITTAKVFIDWLEAKPIAPLQVPLQPEPPPQFFPELPDDDLPF
ncbi:MAG: hypothetical protein O2887_10450 [Bacteroidetes bacterium]|nr:hypothetical protein [Bacteroidota bacterium]